MEKTKNLEVKKFEVNPLTYIPGGSFITIEFSDGSSSKGVNIKHPKKYVETVIGESLLKGLEVTRAYLTGKSSELVYEDGMFFSLTNK